MDDLLKNLKLDVQCFLCNETFTEPKTLRCFHTFCKICIKRHAELIGEEKKQANVFKCPKCSTETLLTELGFVEQLKPSLLHSRIIEVLKLVEGEKTCSVSEGHSLALWYCVDCNRSFCQECRTSHCIFIKNHNVIDSKDLTVESLQILLNRETTRCQLHIDKELKFFCKDCDCIICHDCFEEEHSSHVMVSLESFAKANKAVLSGRVEVLKTAEQHILERLKLQADIALETRNDCETAKETMRNNTTKIIAALEENLLQFENIMDDTIQKAEGKIPKVQCLLDQTRAKINYLNQVIQQGLASEMLENQGICKEQIELPEVSETVLTADIKVHCDKITKCSRGMTLKSQGIAITGNLKMNKVNIQDITGIAINKTNTRIALANFRCHCVVIFDPNGNLLTKYGCLGSEDGQLYCPESLSFLNNRDLVIADFGNNRICIVNTFKGVLVKTFGKQGSNEGEFNNPYGVHVNDEYNIIVSDCGNCRLQVFTKEGVFVYQVCLPTKIRCTPVYSVSHRGLFYVTDYTNGVIHVRDKDGNATSPIGDGQLSRPFGLAIDNDNNLLVCDSGNNCIKKFTLDGRFVCKFETPSIPWLRYVGVLSDSRIMVASISRNRIIFVK